MIHQLKSYLIGLGAEHWATRGALWISAAYKGWSVSFKDDVIHLLRGERELLLATRDYVDVPSVLDCGQFYFETMNADRRDRHDIWDYSGPGWHRYHNSGLQFHMPSFPEEDTFNSYTHWYKPGKGDVVWDVGAHAGFTTYHLSKLVGETGRVYAWEPDLTSYSSLLLNIEHHRLSNVMPIRKALAGKTGTVNFEMDGTMSSGIRDHLEYPEAGRNIEAIEAVSLKDACDQFGVPKYIKMDIEGAEIAVIENALEFLHKHPIEWAIDTNHKIVGQFTYSHIQKLFASIDYEVYSSQEYSNMWCTWARPRIAARKSV